MFCHTNIEPSDKSILIALAPQTLKTAPKLKNHRQLHHASHLHTYARHYHHLKTLHAYNRCLSIHNGTGYRSPRLRKPILHF